MRKERNYERSLTAYFVGVKIFRSRNIRTFVSWRLVTECRLARHGVSVGTSYVNENAGKEFIHYMGISRRAELKQRLAHAKFFCLLLD